MEKLTRKKLNIFIKEFASNEKILDIGAGSGYGKKFFPNRISLDIDPNKNPDIVSDIHNMSIDDDSFDTILCTEVLEHLKDPKQAITEMKRVLKPGGKLILTTRFVFPVHTYQYDYYRFTEFGLRELFKDWKIEKFVEEAGSLETIAILLQRIIFQTKFKGNKLIKGVLSALIYFFLFLQKLVRKEYADIRHEREYKNFICSGYYLVCKK